MAGNERNIKVKIDHVEKIYEGRKGRMVALNGIDLDIMENEFICVVGPSGCGKSTLLNIIAGFFRQPPAPSMWTARRWRERERNAAWFSSSMPCSHG